MTRIHPRLRLLWLATLFCFSPRAFAINSINVQSFNPSTSDHFVFLEDGFKSEWPKVASFYFGANYNYVSEPLVALDPSGSTKQFDVIDNIQTVDLFFGFKVANNFALFLGAPINFIQFSGTAPAAYQLGNVTGLGDVKIEGKIRLTDDASSTSIALIPEFHLPTGSTQYFVSDASAYVGIRAAIERTFEQFTLVGNLGFAVASNAMYQDATTFSSGIDARKRLLVGIGGFLPLNDSWGINAELSNTSVIPFDSAINPNDAYVGVRLAANDGLVFTAGGSLTQIGGPGGSNYRIVGGVRYTLFEDKKQVPKPIYIAPPPPLPSPSPTPMPPAAPMASPAPIAIAQHAVMHVARIEVLTPISFTNNSYQLLPDSKQTLDDVATLMKEHRSAYKKVLIDGHTSGVGTDKYNLRLSLARSKAVKSYLVSRGLSPKVLEARGYGKRNPKVPLKSPGADEINRRVEFIIVK